MLGAWIELVSGSRGWTDRDVVIEDLVALPERVIVVHGNAPRGLDRIVRDECRRLGIHAAAVDALWTVHGLASGPLRNAAMLLLNPDRLTAYTLDTPGTTDMISRARRAGIPVRVRTPGDSDGMRLPGLG